MVQDLTATTTRPGTGALSSLRVRFNGERHHTATEGRRRTKSIHHRLTCYSVTGCSEICQSLPSKTEMWSVFIGE